MVKKTDFMDASTKGKGGGSEDSQKCVCGSCVCACAGSANNSTTRINDAKKDAINKFKSNAITVET